MRMQCHTDKINNRPKYNTFGLSNTPSQSNTSQSQPASYFILISQAGSIYRLITKSGHKQKRIISTTTNC